MRDRSTDWLIAWLNEMQMKQTTTTTTTTTATAKKNLFGHLVLMWAIMRIPECHREPSEMKKKKTDTSQKSLLSQLLSFSFPVRSNRCSDGTQTLVFPSVCLSSVLVLCCVVSGNDLWWKASSLTPKCQRRSGGLSRHFTAFPPFVFNFERRRIELEIAHWTI